MQLIQHLTITDANFDTAIELLKEEFFDQEFIVNEIFLQIIEAKPEFDPEFTHLKQYLSKTRADIHELQNSYGLDFLLAGSPGNKFLSFVVFAKLPCSLKREIINQTHTNYPSINDIFDKYSDIIKTLVITKNKFANSRYTKKKDNTLTPKVQTTTPSSLENFATNSDGLNAYKPHCKFCNLEGHSMAGCSKYKNHTARISRCKELKLCTHCSSNKHTSDDCYGKNNKLSFPCKTCQSKKHIGALCPDLPPVTGLHVSLNTELKEQPFMLPIVNVTILSGNKCVKINCLFDSGSQRSYFSKDALADLCVNNYRYTPVEFDVKTFLGAEHKTFDEVLLQFSLGANCFKNLPVLVCDDFNVEFRVDGLHHAINNLTSLNYLL